ncbi:hypothetical protein E2C01_019788 [Portunus trituberculatus]|uniref:Uncharacterized protein n=1 Tax=Portunus trituberculatus TaxID=210409 RepID=A0A5B7DY77_PORTR|nr:hypothetical protein [Portunus trituberculatus]
MCVTRVISPPRQQGKPPPILHLPTPNKIWAAVDPCMEAVLPNAEEKIFVRRDLQYREHCGPVMKPRDANESELSNNWLLLYDIT